MKQLGLLWFTLIAPSYWGLLIASSATLPSNVPPVQDLVWPRPQSMQPTLQSPSYVPIGSLVMKLKSLAPTAHSKSRCKRIKPVKHMLVRAFHRFSTKTSSKCQEFIAGRTVVEIKTSLTPINNTKHLEPKFLLGMDESYSIHIASSKLIQIQAPTPVGVLHALETLSQLVLAQHKCFVAAVDVQDKPRFAHRGLMLDTARNFFTVKDIKRQLDGMAATKLNVFHWHIYDAQSFPIAWDFDDGKLFKKGAYRTDTQTNETGDLKVYTKADIHEIVGYAFDRGIRVVPEFDMPGHTTVFGNAYPHIMKCMNFSPFDGGKGTDNFVKRRCNQPPCGQFDPDSEEMYTLVNQFLNDMSQWFPDPVLHVGMDEVNAMCWDKPTNDLNLITDPMVKFARRIVDMLKQNSKTMMAWDEAVASYNLSSSTKLFGQNVLPENTIVQVWESVENGNIRAQDAGVPLTGDGVQDMVQVVSSLGYPVVVSPSNAWYLDCSPQVTWCASKDAQGASVWHDWTVVYDYDPTKGLTNPSAVIGGEVAAWSETIKLHNLDFMIWPRAAAMAEKMWSLAESTASRTENTKLRLNRFRSGLVNELKIAASSLDEVKGTLDSTFYRVEWCDFNLDTPAQKSSDIYPGMKPEPDQPLSNYCSVASLYNTESFSYTTPNAVPYPY